MAINLDMEKANDRLNCDLLRNALLIWVFDRWRWIMQCISTATFNILVNDKHSKLIYPERDKRQGDLISPYIFIIYVEYFGCYIHFVLLSLI